MKQLFSILWSALATAPLLFFSACALLGGGGETLTHSKEYSVTAPKNWKEKSSHDADQAYQLSSGNLVTLTSSCKRAEAPLEALTRHLLFGVRNIQTMERKRFKVHGTEALLTRVKGTFESQPVEMLVCVLYDQGCVFDFVLLAPKKVTDGDAAEFAKFIESFHHGK